MLVLLQAASCAGDAGCHPAQDGRCKFPFVMNNISLRACTWYRSYGTAGYPWCATEGGDRRCFLLSDLILSPVLLQLEFTTIENLVPTWLCASQTQGSLYRP